MFFRYHDIVLGRGFVASVETQGRVLCTREDGEFHMIGIEPGGLAAGGSSRPEAHESFRRTFVAVLVDLAHQAGNFEQFKFAVESFVRETSPAALADWSEAVATVRKSLAGKTEPPCAIIRAETPATVTVVMKEVAPETNVVDERECLLPAA